MTPTTSSDDKSTTCVQDKLVQDFIVAFSLKRRRKHAEARRNAKAGPAGASGAACSTSLVPTSAALQASFSFVLTYLLEAGRFKIARQLATDGLVGGHGGASIASRTTTEEVLSHRLPPMVRMDCHLLRLCFALFVDEPLLSCYAFQRWLHVGGKACVCSAVWDEMNTTSSLEVNRPSDKDGPPIDDVRHCYCRADLYMHMSCVLLLLPPTLDEGAVMHCE